MLIRRLVVATMALLMLSAAPAAAQVEITEAARALFKKGVELVRAKDYATAYEAFKAAYAESPSPKILGNLGLAAMHVERDGEAIDAYERYLADSGAVNADEEKQIRDDLLKLKGRVAQVRLTTQPNRVTVIDERTRQDGSVVSNVYSVTDGRLFIGIHRGKHTMTIETGGHASETWSFEAGRGVVPTKTVLLEPLPGTPLATAGPERGDRVASPPSAFGSTGFIVAGSVTGALAIATTVLGVIALRNKSDFDDAVAAGDRQEAVDLMDGGETLNVATDVLLGATIVGAGVTTVLLISGAF